MGYTPLHEAAWRGRTDCVLALMKAGADINLLTKKGARLGWQTLERGAALTHLTCLGVKIFCGIHHGPVDHGMHVH